MTLLNIQLAHEFSCIAFSLAYPLHLCVFTPCLLDTGGTEGRQVRAGSPTSAHAAEGLPALLLNLSNLSLRVLQPDPHPEPVCTARVQEISFCQLYLKAYTEGLVLQGQKRAWGQTQPLALATRSDAESFSNATGCEKHTLVLKRREKSIVLLCFTSQAIPESCFQDLIRHDKRASEN